MIWLELVLGTTDVWSRIICTSPPSKVHRLKKHQQSHHTEALKGTRCRLLYFHLEL
jgi:hypothetical protein